MKAKKITNVIPKVDATEAVFEDMKRELMSWKENPLSRAIIYNGKKMKNETK